VKRLLFNLLAAVSLLLCAAAVVMWVRSYICRDSLTRSTGRSNIDLVSTSGRFVWGIRQTSEMPEPWLWNSFTPPGTASSLDSGFKSLGTEYLGFGWSRINSVNKSGFALMVPAWGLCVLFTVIPGLWICLRLKRFKPDGLPRCVVCGYDLRATPDRCPECGTVPANSAPGHKQTAPATGRTA
jgi:hypothetical protein